MEKLVAILFLTREVTHRLHLKVTSYAQHMALNDLYDGVLGIADDLAEGYQGKYGLMENIPMLEWGKDDFDALRSVEYLTSLFERQRKAAAIDESYLQNIMDNACQLFYKTQYKLKFLK